MSVATSSVIFLHSIWRARSTWLFSRFRRTGRFRCFYEPLNGRLIRLTSEEVRDPNAGGERPGKRRRNLRHPVLPDGYWSEYAGLLQAGGVGVQDFRLSLAFHPFDEHNDPTPYFRSLIASSGARGTVLALSRSPFRLRWIVDRFADAEHFYLERPPDEQFASYAVEPTAFLPPHLAYARLQPGLGDTLERELPELMPGRRKRLRWGDDYEAWRRHFCARLPKLPESIHRAAFQLLWQAARDDAAACGLRRVQMNDLGSIREAFAEYGLTYDDYQPVRGGRARS